MWTFQDLLSRVTREVLRSGEVISLPTYIRVNTLKISKDELKKRLEAQGFQLEEVPHFNDYLRVKVEPRPVSKTLEHYLGFFYIQDLASALPVLTLNPRPSSKVLDCCAAPGGKTTHIAQLLRGEGLIIAVDRDVYRIKPLIDNLQRLGVDNALVFLGDFRFIDLPIKFNYVLVDAPCSSLGTFRRHPHLLKERGENFVKRIRNLQMSLLAKALDTLEVGGKLVYSTCTFTFEENEEVIYRVVLKNRGDRFRLVPIELENIPHEEGITEYEGETYPEDLKLCWRLYPEHLDTNAFFIALIERYS